MRHSTSQLTLAVLLALAGPSTAFAQDEMNASAASAPGSDGTHTTYSHVLQDGFLDPPEVARPRVWWHWLSGNVSQNGIRQDLEWMKRIGIAGAMMFDGDMGAPKIVPERVTVLSPQWYENLKYAASEADRLGLEFAMAAAPGWSETGGPWVTPQMGMKRFAWSQKRVRGGERVGMLPPLPSRAGPFQDSPKLDPTGKEHAAGPSLARDVAVLAFPAPEGDVSLASLSPRLTSNAPSLALTVLADGRLDDKVVLPSPSPEHPIWVQFDFSVPQTMRALTYAGPMGGRFSEGPQGRIEASDDGAVWRSLRTLVGQAHNPAPQRTFAFPETKARYFRVVFETAEVSQNPWPLPPGIALSELAFVPGARVDSFEDKAGFGVLANADTLTSPSTSRGAAVDSTAIIDVTDHLRADGTLDWTPPKGTDWIVLRSGWSLTGEVNHPATPEGTGLEVDKLNPEHVRQHLDAYMTPVIAKLGPLVGKRGLRYLLTDSWEAGQENWTEALPQEFAQRRGYDLRKLIPVLAGWVVDSSDRSDRFLWDYRRTLADLVAESHYGTITRFAKEHDLGYYGEATGAAWPTVADGIQAKSRTDIPTGEFWAMPFGAEPAAFQGVRSNEFPGDIIETRSTAHIYGKPLVAAEALTSSLPQWTSTPWSLKWVVDKYMAMGVNRLIIHTSPHQPGDTHKPGLTLGPFGQVFTRHETWGEMAKPWVDYLARTSYMLQQGQPVTDVLYFYGAGAPSGVPYRNSDEPVDLPNWGFDFTDAEALLTLAQVHDGRIAFPGGASYRVLVLPEHSQRIPLAVLRKLHDLVSQGAILVGARPQGAAGLGDEDAAVRTLADEMWGQTDGLALTVNKLGKGKIYWRRDVEGVLADEHMTRDFEFAAPDPAMKLRFAHRSSPDAEIYFVTNQSAKAGKVPTWFRVSGKQPEIWHADTGRITAASYTMSDGRTMVPLDLDAYDSVFVVFRRPTTVSQVSIRPSTIRTVAQLGGNWSIDFPIEGSSNLTVNSPLGSWTGQSNPELRYYAGTATYRREAKVDASWLANGQRLILDLGTVAEVAEVRVNGKLAGTAWKPPYKVDITEFAKPGKNRIQVSVANSWQNRFVGDLQEGARQHAWTNVASGGGFALLGEGLKASTPLLPSGLLGPVQLVTLKEGQAQ